MACCKDAKGKIKLNWFIIIYRHSKKRESLGYSKYSYDVVGSNIDNVIYPSIDPMVFEVKYPSQDIRGRVVPL